MRKLSFFLVVFAAACAKSASSPAVAPSAPVPSTKAVSDMGAGDLDLRPVSIAAAGFYKSIAPSGRLGFSGVYVDQIEVSRVSEAVSKEHAFVSNPRIVCVGTIVASGSRPPAGGPSGTPNNCKVDGANAVFSLQSFRRVADTVYVGGASTQIRSGRPEATDMCLVMVWRDTAWIGAGRRATTWKNCGR